jgi:hypothetical protein
MGMRGFGGRGDGVLDLEREGRVGRGEDVLGGSAGSFGQARETEHVFARLGRDTDGRRIAATRRDRRNGRCAGRTT